MPLAAELWGRWLRGLYKYGPFSQAADAQTVPQCRELAHAPCTTRNYAVWGLVYEVGGACILSGQ